MECRLLIRTTLNITRSGLFIFEENQTFFKSYTNGIGTDFESFNKIVEIEQNKLLLISVDNQVIKLHIFDIVADSSGTAHTTDRNHQFNPGFTSPIFSYGFEFDKDSKELIFVFSLENGEIYYLIMKHLKDYFFDVLSTGFIGVSPFDFFHKISKFYYYPEKKAFLIAYDSEGIVSGYIHRDNSEGELIKYVNTSKRILEIKRISDTYDKNYFYVYYFEAGKSAISEMNEESCFFSPFLTNCRMDLCVGPVCCKELPLSDENGICYSTCPTENKYQIDLKCVSTCPPGSLVDANLTCHIVCPLSQPYINEANNTCVATCPANTPNIDFNNKCVLNCPSKTPYVSSNGFCVEECGFNERYYKKENEALKCKQSCEDGFAPNEKNECVEIICPAGQIVKENLCFPCVNDNMFKFGNECVKSCPLGARFNSKFECKLCNVERKVLFNNRCLEKCPDNTITNYMINTCETCPLNYFFYNNACVQSCPNDTYADYTKSLCFKCEGSLFYHNRNCHEKCPDNTITDLRFRVCKDKLPSK